MLKSLASHWSRTPPNRRAASGAIVAAFAAQLVLLVSGILTARLLGVEDRGRLALVMLYPAIVTQLGMLDVPKAAVYYLAHREHAIRGNVQQHLLTIMLVQAVALTGCHLFLLAIYIFESPMATLSGGPILWLTALSIVGLLAYQYGLALLQTAKRFSLLNMVGLVPASTYAVVVVLIFVANGSLAMIIGGWVAASVIAGIGTLWVALRIPENRITLRLRMDGAWDTFIVLCRFGSRGILGTASPMDALRPDQLYAGLVLSPAALGLYVVGQAFANFPRFIANNVSLIAYPAIVGKPTVAEGARLAVRFVVAGGLVNLAFVVALAAAMPLLVPFLFGARFVDSVPIAQTLIFGAWCAAVRTMVVAAARGLGHPDVGNWAELSMYPVLVVLGIPLAMWFGVHGLAAGVAGAFLASMLVAIALTVSWVKRQAALNQAELCR